MSSPFDDQDDAATALDEEENDGLIPSYITRRGELSCSAIHISPHT